MREIEITIGGKNTPIRAMDLSQFLNGLSETYRLAYFFFTKIDQTKLESWSHDRKINKFITFIREDVLNTPELYYPEVHRQTKDIEFNKITTNSPIKFSSNCTGPAILALAIAVAIAGGEAEIGSSFKFKVNSLAEAVVTLHKLFEKETR